MQIEYSLRLNLKDACAAIGIDTGQAITIVEHGIIEPAGQTREEWVFDFDMVCCAKRAIRLQRDLQLDWSAIALLVSLLEERDKLRADNAQLHLQLSRFLHD